MSLSAAAIRLLAEKGLTACDIADVAEANEATRSTAAIRQKRYRDNKRDVTRNVTPPPYEDTSTPLQPVEPEGSTPPSRFSVEDAVAAWNELAGRLSLRKAKTIDARRRKLVQTRLRDGGEGRWREALAAVERSKFLRGENDRGWKADLDFFCQPKSFAKLIDGCYGTDADSGKVVQLRELTAEEHDRMAEFQDSRDPAKAADHRRQAAELRRKSA